MPVDIVGPQDFFSADLMIMFMAAGNRIVKLDMLMLNLTEQLRKKEKKRKIRKETKKEKRKEKENCCWGNPPHICKALYYCGYCSVDLYKIYIFF